MQLSPYRALARFAAAAGAGGKIGSAQKENRKTPDGRPHAHAVQQKETSEPGARFASRLSLHVSGRCAHPAANAGGAAKRTCEPGARFASRLSPQCVRPMRTPRCKRGRCDKRDLRARGAVCVQAQPAMCQADAHTPLQTRAVRQKRLASQGRGLRPGSARNVSGRCAHPAANAGGATKETCEPGARCASRLSLHVSGRCAHPAANAGGAAKETCEPGARCASRLSLVEVKRLELPTSCSQSRRATNCATPRKRTAIYFTVFCAGSQENPAEFGLCGEVPFFHLLCPFFYFPEQVYGAIISAEQAAVRRAAGKRNHKRQKSV